MIQPGFFAAADASLTLCSYMFGDIGECFGLRSSRAGHRESYGPIRWSLCALLIPQCRLKGGGVSQLFAALSHISALFSLPWLSCHSRSLLPCSYHNLNLPPPTCTPAHTFRISPAVYIPAHSHSVIARLYILSDCLFQKMFGHRLPWSDVGKVWRKEVSEAVTYSSDLKRRTAQPCSWLSSVWSPRLVLADVVARFTCLLKIRGFCGLSIIFPSAHANVLQHVISREFGPASQSGVWAGCETPVREEEQILTSSENPSPHIWFSSSLILDTKSLKLKKQLFSFGLNSPKCCTCVQESKHKTVKSE